MYLQELAELTTSPTTYKDSANQALPLRPSDWDAETGVALCAI